MYYIKLILLCLCVQKLAAAENILTKPSMIQVQSDNFVISNYVFQNGESLSDLKMHYYTLGSPKKNPQGEVVNAVLLLHWTAASGLSLLSEDFMSALYSPGEPLDANRYFIIIPDSIGHGHSSKPSDGLRMSFPHYGYHDMVDLQYRLVTEKLGLNHLKMVIGTSMGGMHAWLWAERYPHFMDGAMPIVSLPKAVTGRNLLWRQMIAQAIKNDPKWEQGSNPGPLQNFLSAWPFARMLLDGVPHLHHEISTPTKALEFIQEASNEAFKKEAIDVLYVLEASADYDPEPSLDKITTKVFALDFTDDQLDPIELNILPTLIQRVKNGRAVTQKGNASSFGHLTMAHPKLWAYQLEVFISWLD